MKKNKAWIIAAVAIAITAAGCGGTALPKLASGSSTVILTNGESVTVRCPNGSLTGSLEASPFVALCTLHGTPPTTTTTVPKPTTTVATVPTTTPATVPTTTVPVAACTSPVFSTATATGYTWPDNYITYNSQWNDPNAPASGPGSQSMFACNAQNWYVTADMPPPNRAPNDVKTYPNVQENFAAVPISKFT
jgi:hypothetical protein